MSHLSGSENGLIMSQREIGTRDTFALTLTMPATSKRTRMLEEVADYHVQQKLSPPVMEAHARLVAE